MTQPPNQTPDRQSGEPTPEQAPLEELHRTDEGRWGSLAGRMLDDIVRIVEAETKLLEVNFGAALTASVDRAVGQLLGALLILLGGACLLVALIMLLHTWLPMWQSLAISGGVAIAAGFAVPWLSGRMAKKAESELTES